MFCTGSHSAVHRNGRPNSRIDGQAPITSDTMIAISSERDHRRQARHIGKATRHRIVQTGARGQFSRLATGGMARVVAVVRNCSATGAPASFATPASCAFAAPSGCVYLKATGLPEPSVILRHCCADNAFTASGIGT